MGVNNAKTTGKLKTLVSLGLDSQPFELEHEWIKIGKAGVVHANSNCFKFNPRYSSEKIKFLAKPIEIKKACSDCFYEAFPKEITERVSLASKVARKIDNLELDKEHSARTSSALLLKAQSLKEALKTIADKEGLENFTEKVNSILTSAIENLKLKSSNAREELTRLAACEYYLEQANRQTPLVTAEDDKILGFQNSNYVSVALYSEFRKNFVSGKNQDEILALLIKFAEEIRLRDTDQLVFQTSETLNSEKSLHDNVQAMWRLKVGSLIASYATRWYKDVTNLINYDKIALIAISDITDLEDSLTATVAAFLQARVRKSASILAPEIVALWISKCQTMGYNVKSNIYSNFSSTSLYGEILSQAPQINEAALSLWEPYKRDVYQNYIDALKAASKL